MNHDSPAGSRYVHHGQGASGALHFNPRAPAARTPLGPSSRGWFHGREVRACWRDQGASATVPMAVPPPAIPLRRDWKVVLRLPARLDPARPARDTPPPRALAERKSSAPEVEQWGVGRAHAHPLRVARSQGTLWSCGVRDPAAPFQALVKAFRVGCAQPGRLHAEYLARTVARTFGAPGMRPAAEASLFSALLESQDDPRWGIEGLFRCLGGLAHAIEPARRIPSPAFIDRVFHRVLEPAVPESDRKGGANEAREAYLAAALVAYLGLPAEDVGGSQWSPEDIGEAMARMVRRARATDRAGPLLRTIWQAANALEPFLTELQMTALGCGYALGLLDADHGSPGSEALRTLLPQHQRSAPSRAARAMAHGMACIRDPAEALAPTRSMEARTDGLTLVLTLGRSLSVAEVADLLDRVSSVRPRRVHCAEQMLRVLQACRSACTPAWIESACAYAMDLLKAQADRGTPLPADGATPQERAHALAAWNRCRASNLGFVAVRLCHILAELYELGRDRLSAADWPALARRLHAPLDALPPCIRARLGAALAPPWEAGPRSDKQ